MIVNLLTEHHLEFLSLKGDCRGSPESTHVKYHIVGNLMNWLKYFCSRRLAFLNPHATHIKYFSFTSSYRYHFLVEYTRDVFYVHREEDLMKTAKVNAYIMHIFGKIELLSIHAT